MTGSSGFLGTAVVSTLLASGHEVLGLDISPPPKYFRSFCENWNNFEFSATKLDDLSESALEGVDGFVHLAATVQVERNEKAGNPLLTNNTDLTLELADKAGHAGVSTFVFASTCSNYANTQGKTADELSSVEATSHYSESKILAEDGLKSIASSDLNVVVGRFSTLSGWSPSLSVVPLLNSMVADAVRERAIQIYYPRSMRPFVHVYDAAEFVQRVLDQSSIENHSVYNVGAEFGNLTKIDAARIVTQVLPGTEVEIVKDVDDPRSYQVSFAKAASELRFVAQRSTLDAVREVAISLTSST